jgi:hypothetical protein
MNLQISIYFSIYFLYQINWSVAHFNNTYDLHLISKRGLGLNTPLPPNTYVDNSGICPKITFSALNLVMNCSSISSSQVKRALESSLESFVSELILSNNSLGLSGIPFDLINRYDSLRILDLNTNEIGSTGAISLNELKQIDCNVLLYLFELRLDANLFDKLPILNDVCMKKIRALSMSYNKELKSLDLKTANDNTELRMPNLERVDFSFCSIEIMNRDTLTLLSLYPKLVYLNLIGNKIKFIYQNAFLANPALKWLSFENNLNFTCDTRHRWIKDYIIANKPFAINLKDLSTPDNTTLYNPTCYSPLTLTRVNLITLNDNDFTTPIYLSTKMANVNVTVKAGERLQLNCEQYSEPAADLWWSFNNRILSRIISQGDPYIFIENFNSTLNPSNKTSSLIVDQAYTKLSGAYACNSLWNNANLSLNSPYIEKIIYNVNVIPSGYIDDYGQIVIPKGLSKGIHSSFYSI